MLFAILMTVEAARADLCSGSVLEGKDLSLVSPALDVCLSRSMTCLAAVPFWALLCVERGGKMWGALIILEEVLRGHIFVAGFAGFRAYVQRRISRAHVLLGLLLIRLKVF